MVPRDTRIYNPWRVASKHNHAHKAEKIAQTQHSMEASMQTSISLYKRIEKRNLNTYLRIQTTTYE